MVDTDDLVTPAMIAKRFGVVYATVSNWQTRGIGFPEPVFSEGSGKNRRRLWLWSEIVEWAADDRPDLKA